MPKKLCIFVFCIPFLLAGCLSSSTTEANRFSESSSKSLSSLWSDALALLEEKSFAKSLPVLEDIEAHAGIGTDAARALLYEIYAAYQEQNMSLVIRRADRFLRLYNTHQNADYALYMRGVAHATPDRGWAQRYLPTDSSLRDIEDEQSAFNDFKHILLQYPHSLYARDSQQRLYFLRQHFAAHEIGIARFSYQQKRYKAALHYAESVIEHYQETPSIPEALVILKWSAQHLNNAKKYAWATEKIKKYFPEFPISEKQILEKNSL